MKRNHWYQFKKWGWHYPTMGHFIHIMFSRRFYRFAEKGWRIDRAKKFNDAFLEGESGKSLFDGR